MKSRLIVGIASLVVCFATLGFFKLSASPVSGTQQERAAVQQDEEELVVTDLLESIDDDDDVEEKPAPKIPDPLRRYMGRRIAQTMHYEGAEWLTRDTREREERCSLMLANLGVKPGMTICDMGCGNGYYALQLAQMTGDGEAGNRKCDSNPWFVSQSTAAGRNGRHGPVG